MKIKIVMTAAVVLLGAATASQAQVNSQNPTAVPPNLEPQGTMTPGATASGSVTMPDSTVQAGVPAPVWGLYRASELSLDAFGFGTVSEYTIDHLSGARVAHHSKIGAGVGLDYFITRNFGVELEGFSESTHHSFVNDAGGNLVYRFPIGETGLAPYVFGGGGHQFEAIDSSYGDGGAGLEYRFNPHFGLFADARFVATTKVSNYGMGRLGIRFSF